MARVVGPVRSRWRLAAALFVALAVLLAACGDDAADQADGDGSQDGGDGAESTETEQATPTEADGGTEPTAEPTEAGTEGALAEFSGETVTILLPYPGGSYDQILRSLAPHLEEYLDATVQIEVQEGAGGLLAMNHMMNVEPDGLTFGIFSGPGVVAAQLRGAEGIQFDLADLSYIGRVTNDDRFVFVGSHTGHETMQDVIEAESFEWASSGVGSTDYLDPAVIIAVFGLENHDIITGYGSGPETILSILSEETDGQGGTAPERLTHVESGEMQVMMAITDKPAEPFPDAPVFTTDFGLEGDELRVAEAYTAMQAMGRPLIGPPGIPEERLQVLRDALAHAVQQEAFLTEMETANRTVSHLPGEEMEELVTTLLDAPPAFVELLGEEE